MEAPPPPPSSSPSPSPPSPSPPPPQRPSRLSLAGQRRQSSVEASARSGKRPRSPTPDRPAKRRRRVAALSVAVTRPIRGRKASGSGPSLKKASAKLGQRKPRQGAGKRPVNKVSLVLRRPTGVVTRQRHQQWTPKNTIRTFIAQRLPPISEIGEIFDDMTEKAWGQLGLQEATRTLAGRTINVATMCSGTESPLLALDLTNECKSEDFANCSLTSLRSSSFGPHSWRSQVELQASLQR